MQKQTLYQIDSKGKTREWSVEVINEPNGSATILTTSGIKDGSLIPASENVTSGKNIGKANETTPYSQAVLQAQASYDAKLRKGYVVDINNMTDKTVKGSGAPAPMLAQKYDPTGNQNGSRTLDHKKLQLEGVEIGLQPKLDGNRATNVVNLNSSVFYTREGDEFLPIPHLQQQMMSAFKKIYKYVNEKYGVTEYVIDGELYIDPKVMSFNRLNGLLKKQTKSQEDIDLLSQVEYHIYDVHIPVPYTTRMKVFSYFSDTHLKVVETKIIKGDVREIDEFLIKCLEQGYEGAMIRQLTMPYEPGKRSWQLMKVKLFTDSEYKIVGYKKSSEGDTLGSIQFEIIDGLSEGTAGKTFFATPKGLKDAEMKDIWDNQDKHLGEIWTVEYFGLSEYGIPRFPKSKGLRMDKKK